MCLIVSILLFTNTGLDSGINISNKTPHRVSILLFTNTGLDSINNCRASCCLSVSILLFTNTGLDIHGKVIKENYKMSQFSFSRILV